MIVGDPVFFPVRSKYLDRTMMLYGTLVRINPDGTVTCRSASGLVEETVPAEKVEPADEPLPAV